MNARQKRQRCGQFENNTITIYKMPKKLFHIICCLLCSLYSIAQTSDDAYREPLKQVLTEIENQYGITLKYSDALVANHFVTYARWRFRPDVEKTLENVLATQD